MADSFDDYCENCSTNPGVIPTNDEFKRNVQQALCSIVAGAGGGSGGQFFLYQDSEGTPFIAIRTPGSPDASMDFFELDGVTPFSPAGAYEPYCCSSSGSAGTVQALPLCDQDGDTTNSFVRVFTIDSLGAVTYEDVSLAGDPYVPAGTVGFCDALLLQYGQHIELLCDVNGDVSTPFIRVYSVGVSEANISDVQDYDLDGVTYVPTGTVGNCCCESGAAAGAFQEDQVYLSNAPFSQVQYFIGTNTGGGGMTRFTMGQNGVATRVYTGTFPSTPTALFFSADYLTVYGIYGALGAQSIISVNVATGVASAPIALTITAGRLVLDASRNPVTGDVWILTTTGGVVELYTIVPATGVATLQGTVTFNSGQFAGISFTPDGRLLYAYDFGGVTSGVVVELLAAPTSSGTPPFTFELGTIYIKTGVTGVFRGPIAATGNISVLGVSTISGGAVSEYDFSGVQKNYSTTGSISAGGSIAYFNNLRNDLLYTGVPLRRVTELDNTGAVIGTQYFTADGTDVTSLIEEPWVTTHLIPSYQQVLGAALNTQAQHFAGALAFGSVTTTYANLIAVAGNLSGKVFLVTNMLNTDVYVSFNDGSATDQIFIPSGGERTISYGSSEIITATALRVRSIGANAESGSIYATMIGQVA